MAETGRRFGIAGALVRPPGSLPEARFLQACIRCGECFQASNHVLLADGLRGWVRRAADAAGGGAIGRGASRRATTAARSVPPARSGRCRWRRSGWRVWAWRSSNRPARRWQGEACRRAVRRRMPGGGVPRDRVSSACTRPSTTGGAVRTARGLPRRWWWRTAASGAGFARRVATGST